MSERSNSVVRLHYVERRKLCVLPKSVETKVCENVNEILQIIGVIIFTL